MGKFKKYFRSVAEIIFFIFALGVFCYSGYKIARHYGFLNIEASAESCGSCSSCLEGGWLSDLCRKLKDWCQGHCPCQPTPTFPPEPTPSIFEPTPTGIEPTPTGVGPTPTGPTPTSQPSGGGGGESGGGGGGPAVPCTPPEAPKIPELLSAVSVSPTEVKLTWKKVDRATHYAVVYGETSHNYTYGNSNVGNTDTYTVGGLKTGRVYFFALSAAIGGDCPVASPYSNELSSRPIGTVVLGVKTDPPQDQIKEDQFEEEVLPPVGEVAGAKTDACPFWWLVLLGQTILLTVYYGYLLKRQKQPKRWWLAAPILVILAYAIDYYAHTHWYIPSRMCPWEKWLGVGLASLETVGYYRLRYKTS